MLKIMPAITNELWSIVKFVKWFFESVLVFVALGFGLALLLSIPISAMYAIDHKSYWAGAYSVSVLYLFFRFGVG